MGSLNRKSCTFEQVVTRMQLETYLKRGGNVTRPQDLVVAPRKSSRKSIAGQGRDQGGIINALIRCFVQTRDWDQTLQLVKLRYKTDLITKQSQVVALGIISDKHEDLIEFMPHDLNELGE